MALSIDQFKSFPMQAAHSLAIEARTTDLIKSSLTAFARKQLNADGLATELMTICDDDTEAMWAALSQLDQYHRRRVLPTDVFLRIKSELSGKALQIPATTRSRDATQKNGERRSDRISAPATADPTIQLRCRVGEVLLDRYELTAPSLRGGPGALFKALDRRRLSLPDHERYVAIKFLLQDSPANTVAAAILEHEFTQTQKLSHPNIVSVYDFDVARDQGFIVMELLDGDLLSRLTERLAPRRISQPMALAIVRELGLALVCAHENDVVHGDVQPRNIMITQSGELRLMNFSQASILRRMPWLLEGLGASELRSLTSAYCSRECAKGLPPDARDDLYSLACIAYELLAGRAAFANGECDSAAHLPRPNGLNRRQWRALRHALACDRQNRPNSVREWLDELDLHKAADRIPALNDIGALSR
jgi:serine/threonine protein kinase